LKQQFQNLCNERKSTMTTEIVRFILDCVGNAPSKSNDRVWREGRNVC